MKPNWSDAPEWAKYLAMDADERWFWYQEKPVNGYCKNEWSSNGEYQLAYVSSDKNWRKTLEERPNI